MPEADFADGRLPAVCVTTGAPATSNLHRRYSTTPSWVAWLFFVNWIALLLAITATRRSASGELPVCGAVALDVRRWHARSLGLFIIALLAWVTAIGVASVAGVTAAAVAVAGGVALIGAAMAALREGGALGVRGRVVEDGFGMRWVQLRGVHPAFAAALAAHLNG